MTDRRSSDTEELLGEPSPSELQTSRDSGEDHGEDSDAPLSRQYYCGFGKCRPKWLQLFINTKFIIFVLCFHVLVESSLTGFNSVVVSTIEKRYKFSSTAASFISSAFDLAVILCVVFVSYFGGKGHKPRWLGIGLIIQGVGALVFALPQFLFGKYKVGSKDELRLESCMDDGNYEPDCDAGNIIAYMLFLLGRFVMGVGASPLYTVGVSYIDDIVHPKYVSIPIGIFYTSAIVGPSIGYGLGGAFLSVYVDPWKSTSLKQTDPSWVGAWWLCHLFVGVASFLVAVPLLMFPRELPNSHLVMEARRQEMAKKYRSKYGEEKQFSVQLKTFPIHLKRLLKNPSWVFTTLGISALFFALDGIIAFAPKYFESQFGLTASTSSLIAGAIAIPAAGVGVVIGTIIVYSVKSKGKGSALLHCVGVTIALAPVFGFFAYCPTPNIAGITTEYPTGGNQLNSSCNFLCNCSSTIFEPVCGADGVSYFSPCRAGCKKTFENNDTSDPMFINCACVLENLWSNTTMFHSHDELIGNSTAKEGTCDRGCISLGIFILGAGLVIFFAFIIKTPTVTVTIRCVADEQRTFALGLQSLIFRVLGSIPGPVAIGAIIDSTCIYWQYECGRRENCWVYDNRSLALKVFAVPFVGIILDIACSFMSWLLYPRKKVDERQSDEVSLNLEDDVNPQELVESEGSELEELTEL